MVAQHKNSIADASKISAMNIYNDDSVGRRIAWARKNVEWTDIQGVHHKGMTGSQLGRRLVTQGTVTGVRNVYVSQLENNHCSPSLPMLRKIAEVTGVTVGFLLMETDNPYPARGKEQEPEPVYFSPEADAAAKVIDAIKDAEKRGEMLAVLRIIARTMAAPDVPTYQPPSGAPQHNVFAQRLIASEQVNQHGGKVRA